MPASSIALAVSVNLDEAPNYGIGYSTDEDVCFWWSRNAYFAPQVIVASLDDGNQVPPDEDQSLRRCVSATTSISRRSARISNISTSRRQSVRSILDRSGCARLARPTWLHHHRRRRAESRERLHLPLARGHAVQRAELSSRPRLRFRCRPARRRSASMPRSGPLIPAADDILKSQRQARWPQLVDRAAPPRPASCR